MSNTGAIKRHGRTLGLLAAVVTLPLVVSGCASDLTSCPLDNEYGYCASMADVNQAAAAGGGDAESVMADAVRHDGDSATMQASGDSNPLFSPGPGNDLSGPIYKPAQPRRLWVAPWTDADGTLHSGEYLYFLSPGHWNYGPMMAPGSASGVMGPVAPDDLGFKPSATPKKKEHEDKSSSIVKPKTTLKSQFSHPFRPKDSK